MKPRNQQQRTRARSDKFQQIVVSGAAVVQQRLSYYASKSADVIPTECLARWAIKRALLDALLDAKLLAF